MEGKTLRRATLLGALAAAALCTAAGAAAADAPDARPRRVLAIHGFEPGLPVDATFGEALRSGLPVGADLALYSEYIDRVRFPDPAYVEAYRAWLRFKYASSPPDVIVAIGPDAVDFLADARTTPFPGVPVVFGMVPDGVGLPPRLPPGFTGFSEHFAIRETLDLALALFPDTMRVALVGGASALDRSFSDLLRREVAASGHRLEVLELFALPMKDLRARLGALPPHTVVLVVTLFQDGAGRRWASPQSIPAMASASTAPVFGVITTVLGKGAIGGVLTDFEESGRIVAGMVQRVLAGDPRVAIPGPEAANRALVDGRQLDRFGVPDARVPAGVEVRLRQPSLWEGHRAEIVIVALGFLLQSALVGLLLVERRRRRRAETRARENLVALAHMNRASALGELVGSLAHEINSPLGAVLNNAEAAQRLLSRGDQAEVRACLEDIASDAARAGEVIRRIAGVLRREPWAPAPLQVATVIRDALRLVKAVARDRGVSLEVQTVPPLPDVTGDPVQLVQVVVNLLVNAFDAVAGLPEGRRRVRIAAEPRGDAVAILVVDSGPGVPAANRERVFEPFFTTKRSGIGMGLSISRSIVEAHRGTISVSEARDGGAAFEVLLPATEGASLAARHAG